MAIRLRPLLLVLAGLSILLGTFGQVMGSFDDDDPDNDPNWCSSAAAPENCDWTCGWFQAAVNMEIVPVEAARTSCPHLHRTDWLPEEEKQRRESDLASAIQRYDDGDPTNDPNVCFASSDPNCDWEAGWYASIANYSRIVQSADQAEFTEDMSDFLSFLKQYLSFEPTSDPDDPSSPGQQPSGGSYRWFCAPGEENCPRPDRQCAPGEDFRNGGCYILG